MIQVKKKREIPLTPLFSLIKISCLKERLGSIIKHVKAIPLKETVVMIYGWINDENYEIDIVWRNKIYNIPWKFSNYILLTAGNFVFLSFMYNTSVRFRENLLALRLEGQTSLCLFYRSIVSSLN